MALVAFEGYRHVLAAEQEAIVARNREREHRSSTLTAQLIGLQKQIEIDVIEVQQFLTDFAATKGQDGHDAGLANAKAFADRFPQDLAAARNAAELLGSAEIAAALDDIGRRFPGFYELGREMAKTYAVQGTRAGNVVMDRFDSMTEELRARVATTKTALDAVVARNHALVLEDNAKIDAIGASSAGASLAGVGVIILTCLIGAIVSHCWVIQPLTWITFIFKRLAHGDIDWGTHEASRADEIGDLARVYDDFRRMTIERTEAQKKVALQQVVVEAEQRQTKLLAERFDTALSNMPLGLVMVDRDQRVLVANPKLSQLLGLSAETPTLGRPLRELLRRSTDAGCVGEPDVEQLLGAFKRMSACRQEHNCGQGVCPLIGSRSMSECNETREFLIETNKERVLEFSVHPMENGGYLMLVEDISEKRSAQAAVHRLAYFDPLTDLPNRRSLFEDVERALTETALKKETFALLFVDLDHFKHINDSLGHEAGDDLLIEVASRLASLVRKDDVVARLGGDEFVILQRGVNRAKDIMALAERVIECLRAPFLLAGKEIRVSASVGISRAPRNGDDRETLLRNADTALYRAKACGRNNWRFFKPGMHAEIVARAALENDLREAIANKALDIYFQPILHTDGEYVAAFEALLRWRHPERGMVSPAEFIPIAEETGLIVDLGTFVIERACEACAAWPDDIRVAVNLSALQFRKGDLVAVIQNALSKSGLAPNRLELEITESVLLYDTEIVCDTLKKLRCLGVTIALDDFGTGYSSLSYLHKFPLDRVKIDRSFLRKASDDQNALTLLHGMIRLGVEMGLGLVIEGVETADQLRLVRDEYAAAEVQGFLFSPAVPASEVPKFLVRGRERKAA